MSLTLESRKSIDDALKKYKEITAAELRILNHSEAPWKTMRDKIPEGVPDNKVIPKTLIRDYHRNIMVLDEVATYEDNWDGEGSKAFAPELLECILSLINNLNPQPFIAPTGRGSMQFDYGSRKSGRKYLGFEIFSPDNVQMYYKDEADNSTHEDISVEDIVGYVSRF